MATPPIGWYRINFDGAVFVKEIVVGLGSMIRNENSLIMTALSQKNPLPASIDMVEVLAATWTLLFAKELGLEYVTLEGDAEIIINAILGDNIQFSSYGHIIHDIKTLASSLHRIHFNFIRRQGNIVAHSSLDWPLHLLLYLFGWSLFLQICNLYTTMIWSALINIFHLVWFSNKKRFLINIDIEGVNLPIIKIKKREKKDHCPNTWEVYNRYA